jgi:hypothetical protein
MRRITQNTITDRIFGNRQDRQAVNVVGNARGITVALRLWSKRPLGHDRRAYHGMTSAAMSCHAAYAAAADWVRGWVVGPKSAFCCPAFVELTADGRC